MKVLVKGDRHEYLDGRDEVRNREELEKLVGQKVQCECCGSRLQIKASDLPRIKIEHYDNGAGNINSLIYDYWGMSCPVCKENIKLAVKP